MTNQNPMKKISIAKLTLNIGAGKDEGMLKKGLKLLQKLSPLTPVKTVSKKRIPAWGLRPGLVIGCKVTIRKDAEKLLKRLLAAKENILSTKNFDNKGNLAFGIKEYLDIPGAEYDPGIGVIGLEAAVTLERKGYRIKRRKLNKSKIGIKHLVTKEDAKNFIMKKFNVKVIEGEEE